MSLEGNLEKHENQRLLEVVGLPSSNDSFFPDIKFSPDDAWETIWLRTVATHL